MPPKKAASPPTAYRRAVLRLARRDQTAAELRRALAGKGHGAEEIESAIDRLRREGYLDDGGYAERFARSRMAHQGIGRARIRQGLRQRGVARAEVEHGLAAALAEVDEAAVVDALARRYWKQHARVAASRRLLRLWTFLVRRGFPASVVRERLRALWPRWSDALEGIDPAEEAGAFAPADERE